MGCVIPISRMFYLSNQAQWEERNKLGLNLGDIFGASLPGYLFMDLLVSWELLTNRIHQFYMLTYMIQLLNKICL
jgi:hypothetical protein